MNRYNYDTHMHLDLYKNKERIIEYIEDNKSYTIAMTNLPELYERYSKQYTDLKYVRFAVGLHPQLIPQYIDQLPTLLKYIKHCRYVGEIGLDFQTIDNQSQQIQVEAFSKIISTCNLYGNKILSVHCRRSTKKTLEIIGSNFNGRVILHWFSGNMTELKTAIQNGYYFSINSDMIATKKGCMLLENIPLDRILIESDAPFTKCTKEEYNIDFIEDIQRIIASIKRVSLEEIKVILFKNFRELLS